VVICPISASTRSRQVACGDDAPVGYGGVERSRVVEQGVERCGVGAEGGVFPGGFAGWLSGS
jgi:hypothetical protein